MFGDMGTHCVESSELIQVHASDQAMAEIDAEHAILSGWLEGHGVAAKAFAYVHELPLPPEPPIQKDGPIRSGTLAARH